MMSQYLYAASIVAQLLENGYLKISSTAVTLLAENDNEALGKAIIMAKQHYPSPYYGHEAVIMKISDRLLKLDSRVLITVER